MNTNRYRPVRFLCLSALLLLSPHLGHAAELSTQEIIEKLKFHQDKVKSIEALFTMTVFGVEQMKMEMSGKFNYNAPDQVLMEFQKPTSQKIKIQGNEASVSLNGAPFRPLPPNEKNPGANNDLFYYHFLKQFFLDIDTTNKPAESHLYKVLVYQKGEDGKIASSDSVLNSKIADFIYDRNRGLVTQINFAGHNPMPPMELKTQYEEKNGCWVQKAIIAKVITPGGAISSIVKMENAKVEKF